MLKKDIRKLPIFWPTSFQFQLSLLYRQHTVWIQRNKNTRYLSENKRLKIVFKVINHVDT